MDILSFARRGRPLRSRTEISADGKHEGSLDR